MSSVDEVVSVIITTHYRNDHLREAVESALEQTHSDMEIVVVDDSGEAHARRAVETYDVVYVAHEENHGTNTARNTGVQNATGRYVQFLDDDDRLHREKIRKQLEVFNASDGVGVVYSGVHLSGEDGSREVLPETAVRGDVLPHALTLEMFPCYTSSMLIDRDVLERMMPFAVRPSVDDLWLMIELAMRTEFDYVDETLVTKSQSEGSHGQGMVNVHGRFALVEEFADLYEQLPPSVRGTALGNAYHQMGSVLLNERSWSGRATLAYWKALYHRPDPTIPFVGACIAAVFGRPGIDFLKQIRNRITGSSST